MKKIIDLSFSEARNHFLKGTSYFHNDLPSYISFEPVLIAVEKLIGTGTYYDFQSARPDAFQNVNYNMIANKDGRWAWRPLELIHPAIYVALVNEICKKSNWETIGEKVNEYSKGIVKCCSSPVMSIGNHTDTATQVHAWWQDFEQESIKYSLEFSHLLHTDVTDCYGSLYTHSISWALHGLPESKNAKRGKMSQKLLGDSIGSFIQAGRYGQTNGISQGSALMDFIAELVLGYVDHEIAIQLKQNKKFRILRYRDDYRVFANSDEQIDVIVKVISDALRNVGMKLGASKTITYNNVVTGSIKPDKLAGIDLQDLGFENAKTIQKQLLRLHSFGQRYPNSGALQRLASEFHVNISNLTERPDDLEVLVAITTDIGFISPAAFPPISGILSHLIALAPSKEKTRLWAKVRKKMSAIPHNGFLEIWLQRVIQPESIGLSFDSDEAICKIVNGKRTNLWSNDWIASRSLLQALDVSKIVVGNISDTPEKVDPAEVALFRERALAY